MKTFKLLLLLSLSLLSGCAQKQKCRNCQYASQIVARFDKKQCRDLPDGKFVCRNVVFDPKELKLK